MWGFCQIFCCRYVEDGVSRHACALRRAGNMQRAGNKGAQVDIGYTKEASCVGGSLSSAEIASMTLHFGKVKPLQNVEGQGGKQEEKLSPPVNLT